MCGEELHRRGTYKGKTIQGIVSRISWAGASCRLLCGQDTYSSQAVRLQAITQAKS
jgi:hypothetical protein